MRLFEHIVQHTREKGERETESARVRILSAHDIQAASRAMYDAMKDCSGHSAKSVLITCFQTKVREETDVNRIYAAFEDMYQLYRKSGDPLAMSIARMLGEAPAAKAARAKKYSQCT